MIAPGVEHAFHYPGSAGHFDDVIDATAEFLLDRLGGHALMPRCNREPACRQRIQPDERGKPR
jgi:hypothetical protein